MPDILRQASDDQIALIICFGAIVVSGLIMHFSIHVGRLTGRVRLHQMPEQRSNLVPGLQSIPARRSEEIAARDRAA